MNAPDLIAAALPEPGVYYGLDASQYHAAEALSSSGAKKLLRSPLHYLLMRTQPAEPTAAMVFGTACHTAVLEPDCFAQRIAQTPDCDKRSSAGKAEWAAFHVEHAGKLHLNAETIARVQACAAAVRAHPAAAKLLDGGQREVSLFWQDRQYGVDCKCRFDLINRGGATDLKTTTDASPEAFGRQCANLLYHLSAAHYISGAEHVLHESPRFWAFIAVESEPPHAVAVYSLPSNAVLAGAHLMAIALERYRDALQAQAWPGYPDTIEALPFPKWATRLNY